ncbi:hypothetical protein [Pontibaca salina]|uniref:Uncharacterized protein n=1 Tax=Pontibaca salina TaxID=2795731 RepID=A0A934M194_9RHOB|nr:hypothetical protein [Pontibaca salina]MBI6630553.1 hypothetical protein [Pontibaca salina]
MTNNHRSPSEIEQAIKYFYEEECAKAGRVVYARLSEAQKVADETLQEIDERAPGDKTAAQAAADKTKSAAERMADTG